MSGAKDATDGTPGVVQLTTAQDVSLEHRWDAILADYSNVR